jgi:ABC-type multidrug transport system fused ATPase/permease subunit
MKNTCSKIFFLIGEKKLRLFIIFSISLLISFMEMLSIGLIIPIIAFIFDNNFIIQLKKHIPFLDLNSFTNEYIIFLLIIFIFIVFFIKFIINCIFIVLKNNFTFYVRDRLIEKLYKNILFQNDNFITSNHSSKVIMTTTVLVDDFAVSVLDKSIEFFSDLIMISVLFFVVLFLQTKISLIALSVFIFFFISHRVIIKNKASAWGQARLESDLNIQKYISETFNTVREIKIYLKQNYFINNIKSLIKKNSIVSKKQMKVVDFQKHFIEIIVITFFLFTVYFMKSQTQISNIDLITFLGVCSGVLFKMLPATNRILNNLQRISFALPSINSLYNELNSHKYITNQDYLIENDYSFNKKISLINLNYIYDKKKIFIKDINFEILRGDCFGIVGESGSGKTTLIKVLTGLLNNYQGKILIDDINLNINTKNWFSKVSYVPQNIFLLDSTIRANVAFGEFHSDIDDFQIKKSLDEAQISEFRDNLDLFVGERGSKISGGQQQRIMIARALYRKPEIIFFDEATSALDIDNEKKILNTIQLLKNKYTIIISTHRSETLSICNKVYDIKNNKFI